MSAMRASQLGWYARRLARMSPAEVPWRAHDQVLQLTWSRRQVRREQLARITAAPPAGQLRFTAALPAGATALVPEEARKAVLAAGDRLLRGVDDRGVVAVLDSRMATARYGGYLRASLPPFWATTDGAAVRAALERLTATPA